MSIRPRQSFVPCLLGMVMCCLCISAEQSTEPTDEGPWHRVKSASGTAKSRLTHVKFLVTTQKWRLTVKTEAAGERPESNSIRMALMSESARDVDDKPVNWKQEMIICDGKPGQAGSKIFDNGLTKDGKPRWFQISINGFQATYEITAEDQSRDDSKPSKSKKKK